MSNLERICIAAVAGVGDIATEIHLHSSGVNSEAKLTTVSVLNAVRERAQTSKDIALKGLIGELYDHVNNLKEAMRRVTEENSELRDRLASLEKFDKPETPKPELRRAGLVNFYFVGNDGPYCQKCYDSNGKLTKLSPAQAWSGGIRRHCVVCEKYIWETPWKQT